MSLYTEIKNKFKLINAYEDWEDYRNTLTAYLIELADCEELPLKQLEDVFVEEKLPTVALVGAGACNDMNLKALLPYFSKITLIDMDEEALDEGLERAGFTDCALIEKKIISFHGITDEDYEAFTAHLQSYICENYHHMTPNAFCNEAAIYVEKLFRKKQMDLKKASYGTYDYVWCFGVHSQLQSMFGYIYRSFLHNLKDSIFENEEPVDAPFYHILKNANQKQVPVLNDLLIQSAMKCCVLGNEWDVLQNDEEYRMEMLPKHPVEGAYQAICDVRKREGDCEENILLWPFDRKRDVNYVMLIQKITKIN